MPKPPSSRPFVSLANGTFRLGDALIFENTSWTYNRHEQWAIIGANGSGKSLFGDALRGRLPLVGGELDYHFRPERGLSAQESIDYVSFERRKIDLHEVMAQSRWNSIEEEGAVRVGDFLAYERVMDVNPFEITDLHEHARPLFERRRRRAVSLMRVEPFLDRTLMSLSNGEMQRVQLARALCRPSRLLILDEPFAGLDASARTQFHAVLRQLLHSPMRTLLIVTRKEDLPDGLTHLAFVDRCRLSAAGPVNRILGLKSVRDQLQTRKAVAAKPTPVCRQTSNPERKPLLGRELVRMNSVTVCYGEKVIFDKLDWTIRQNESWALLGPNGSGKTTLLGLILGDHPQVYGNNVVVFGKKRGTGESMWDIKRHIGWFSPELLLHFEQDASCFEVVASGFHDSIGLFERPTPRQRAAVRALLKEYDIASQADEPLYGLSAGVQRIVLLLRALVKNPRLLILDEPCHGLDRAHREFFVHAVNEVVRFQAATVVYVTHRRDEIPPLITRQLVLGQKTD